MSDKISMTTVREVQVTLIKLQDQRFDEYVQTLSSVPVAEMTSFRIQVLRLLQAINPLPPDENADALSLLTDSLHKSPINGFTRKTVELNASHALLRTASIAAQKEARLSSGFPLLKETVALIDGFDYDKHHLFFLVLVTVIGENCRRSMLDTGDQNLALQRVLELCNLAAALHPSLKGGEALSSVKKLVTATIQRPHVYIRAILLSQVKLEEILLKLGATSPEPQRHSQTIEILLDDRSCLTAILEARGSLRYVWQDTAKHLVFPFFLQGPSEQLASLIEKAQNWNLAGGNLPSQPAVQTGMPRLSSTSTSLPSLAPAPQAISGGLPRLGASSASSQGFPQMSASPSRSAALPPSPNGVNAQKGLALPSGNTGRGSGQIARIETGMGVAPSPAQQGMMVQIVKSDSPLGAPKGTLMGMSTGMSVASPVGIPPARVGGMQGGNADLTRISSDIANFCDHLLASIFIDCASVCHNPMFGISPHSFIYGIGSYVGKNLLEPDADNLLRIYKLILGESTESISKNQAASHYQFAVPLGRGMTQGRTSDSGLPGIGNMITVRVN